MYFYRYEERFMNTKIVRSYFVIVLPLCLYLPSSASEGDLQLGPDSEIERKHDAAARAKLEEHPCFVCKKTLISAITIEVFSCVHMVHAPCLKRTHGKIICTECNIPVKDKVQLSGRLGITCLLVPFIVALTKDLRDMGNDINIGAKLNLALAARKQTRKEIEPELSELQRLKQVRQVSPE